MRVRELLNVAVLAVVIASAIAACAGTAGRAPPPSTAPSPGETATPTETTPPATGPSSTSPAAGGTLLADGQPCFDNGSCNSGLCEGQGCTQAEPGTCTARARACTRDLRDYCGCDGVTFKTSGSCPGRRFASEGACPGGAP